MSILIIKTISAVTLLFLTGCIRVTTSPDAVENYYGPTNNREWTLKKRLEAMGYKDVLFRIPMNRRHNYRQTYYLIMSPQFCITPTNRDSILRFRDSLSKELYANVIADSILVDLKYLFIVFNSQKSKICKNQVYTSNEYAAEELAGMCRFKVFHDADGGFKRISQNN